jgi:hypothetical protein
MKELNALLEDRQEAITPFISGNLGKKLSFLATYSGPKFTPKRNHIPKCSKIRSNAKRLATFLWTLAH